MSHLSEGQWSEEVLEAEVVVLAVGIGAMKLITANSPDLAAQSDFAAVANLRGVDVMAVRLWFDRKVRWGARVCTFRVCTFRVCIFRVCIFRVCSGGELEG